MTKNVNSKSSTTRRRLSKLLREGGELITVERAAEILGMSDEGAAKSLARWCDQGWLARIKRGLYVAVPIEADTTGYSLEDAWVMIPELFEPAYVGGWSAAEHWDLTEQIFKDICIFTARPVSRRNQTYHDIPFVVSHTSPDNQFGTKPVWRNDKRIWVSDPSRTIIDMLSDPRSGGGIRHVVDCLREYFKSDYFREDLLIEYALKLGNGAVFKRLGFLASQLLGDTHPIVADCKTHLSKGNSKLDPTQKADKLVTKWRLLLPANFQIENDRI